MLLMFICWKCICLSINCFNSTNRFKNNQNELKQEEKQTKTTKSLQYILFLYCDEEDE